MVEIGKMGTHLLDQILQDIEKLTFEEQTALIARLQSRVTATAGTVTRERILTEFERRKSAEAFKKMQSLRGKYAHPALDLTFEEIQAMTDEVATEWENEQDELDGGR